jgi:hypothetical protein
MKLGEMKHEIEQSARSALAEKAYPITSGWVPVTDVPAIIDRFEKEWRRELEAASTVARKGSHDELKQTVENIVARIL